MFSEALKNKAIALLKQCQDRELTLATAESCTGGMIATLLTEIPGCSSSFERGYITYSNESKTQMLGVDAGLIEKHGAVSAEVAEAMVKGAIKYSGVDLAVSVTGIAGPDGGSEAKPVGLVYIGVASGNKIEVKEFRFSGNRNAIRTQSVEEALGMLKALLCY
jgi:PncC family amidohydrolase